MSDQRNGDYSDEQWESFIRTGLEFLQDVASRGRAVDVVSYSDFNAHLGTEQRRGPFNTQLQRGRDDLSNLLEEIAERDVQMRGIETDPQFLLTALITFVNDKSHPGAGFFKLAMRKNLLKPKQDKFEFWILQVNAARD
jgi:hypothetical protein